MAHLLFSTVECLNTSHVVSMNSRLDTVRLLKQKKLIVYEIEIELHVMNLPANILRTDSEQSFSHIKLFWFMHFFDPVH